jgi:hypothetical protein
MSSINPNNIDGTYPIARQDNDSQGFRDNFTNIKNNFTFAQSEMDDLQSKVLLKSALAGTELSNDLANSQLLNVQLLGTTETLNNLGSISGAVAVSWADAQFQHLITTGAISLTFSSWPTSGFHTKLRLAVNIADVSHTLTLPSAVSIGNDRLQGVDVTGLIVTFVNTGWQVLEFTTYDNGTTITVEDVLNNYNAAATSEIGFSAGATGTVTQLTDKTTTVVLNTAAGDITTDAGVTLAADTTVSFTLTNDKIALRDLVMVSHDSGGTLGSYTVTATAAAGSATIFIRNVTGGALDEAIVLRFAVIKTNV